ncbi:hypothetical protein GGR50DRAFT_650868 [Xylaria sp. CBS 124048]|nr:hypothetical protein GGR50DRAFT_650868 [Xylaria sp. CBS 124048]
MVSAKLPWLVTSFPLFTPHICELDWTFGVRWGRHRVDHELGTGLQHIGRGDIVHLERAYDVEDSPRGELIFKLSTGTMCMTTCLH